MTKVALITGITGQDGRYLSEFLIAKGYEVHGTKRRVSYPMPFAIDERITIHSADLSDSTSLINAVRESNPDEIYNLAAMSDVHESFAVPEYTANINGMGFTRLLTASIAAGGTARIYQASTSEMFGGSPPPQNEETRFHPRSPYAAAKAHAYWTGVNYREAYGIFVSNGIMFNHESPYRGHQFVTRKITRGLSRIALGLQDQLMLGNLDARRDWGHARDCVRAQWMIMQHSHPDDFVIATGVSRTVREFADLAAQQVGIKLEWHGTGVSEHAISADSGKTIIGVDPAFFRPSEPHDLCGDASKAKRVLGWEPMITFESLVSEMMEHDMKEAKYESRG